MPKRTRPWSALFALCLGFFMVMLDISIVNIAVPSMVRELGTELTAVIWVTSVYLLAYAVPILPAGRLGDRFGPKRVFVAGLVVFTAASLWCGLSGDVETLIVARAVQGFGAALMTPQTTAFITHLFPPDERGPAMGAWGSVAGLAMIAGPVLGGLLVDQFGWEWIFFANVPVGLIALVLTVVLVPDWRPGNSHRFDVPGILLFGAGLVCVVFGIQNGQTYGWGTAFDIIGAGVLLLGAFVLWQRANRREPLLPLRIFRHRDFSLGTASAVTVGFTMTGMLLVFVVYIQSVLGLSPADAGLLIAPLAAVSGGVAPFAGRLSDRVNPKYLLMSGMLALSGGLCVVSQVLIPASSPQALLPGLLLCGLGVGFTFSPMNNVTINSVERSLVGSASGIFNTARQVGGVLGGAAVGALLEARTSASMVARANEAAAALPAEFRQRFLDGFAGAAGSAVAAGEFGGVPEAAADLPVQARELVAQVTGAALTDAVKVAFLLPAGVLLVGVVCAVSLRGPIGQDRSPDRMTVTR
ncbi:DHA2 family efflux MFS transporter permease subunit [Amycolatopsis keratiniphila]|uniref:DHA2 family efflux MFS transporter permease subunit n=1 Tax=Amycolatopsis keratiniphila TaxID=129921 RepID=UPI00087D6A91|nr:DHA2 family efflux MFS transporter permease subunit [Amycolatopsis keratiniphila]OLZ54831.1 MFS transporter [Amycolatopsis keratiniphila subsp. nogabecina]SDU65585.1 drug resistance transporter, EmrB/QacA subfamily [Amycolatopsis keratiniphila]